MSALPKSWAECLIGDIAKVAAGGTPPSKDSSNFCSGDDGIPWVTPADLSGYRAVYISRGERNLTDKGFNECSAIKIPAGSVLFSSRAPIGYVAIASNEVTTSQGFKSFIVPDGIDKHYLYYYLKYIKPVAENLATGTTFKELSGSAAMKLPFVVAPSREQERIAKKLDKLFERIEKCREKLDRVPAILKKLREAIVSEAVSGSQKDTLQQNSIILDDEERTSFSLSELCVLDRPITYGVIKLGAEVSGGIPCLRTSNVRWLRIDLKGIKKIAPAVSADYSRTILQGGEVLVNVRGTLGGVSVATEAMKGWNVSREVAVVPVDSAKVYPEFLALYIGSKESQSWLGGVERGVAYTGINLEDLRNLPIKLPSLTAQKDAVRRVEVLFSAAERLESQYAIATSRVDALIPALLSAAFEGRLLEQDPTDEPAKELIERLTLQLKEQKGSEFKSGPRIKTVSSRKRKLDKKLVKDAIGSFPENTFSFDDLRELTLGNYEELKDIVFALLKEEPFFLKQKFDEKSQSMCLVRASA
ncbi:restriction endonuclease subunit S [Pseudomonas sp. 21615526]|uniref:restriction endonuclease subunit S n=1 Tax=Pseudomonas sp. 21615526 TaxID=2738811 RepID=UPI0015B84B4C|nr:restriction endonuclease subunit S [Pseudomonas sp. 21615526]NVZ39906.1 restriction endonuclease subunit S [Pseudomonas sp. 21615526]